LTRHGRRAQSGGTDRLRGWDRGSIALSQAGGSKGGDDRAVRVSNGGSTAQLAGAMSAEGGKCASCDADGGIGDAGCDKVVPNED